MTPTETLVHFAVLATVVSLAVGASGHDTVPDALRGARSTFFTVLAVVGGVAAFLALLQAFFV